MDEVNTQKFPIFHCNISDVNVVNPIITSRNTLTPLNDEEKKVFD
jgi:hypothetical protein